MVQKKSLIRGGAGSFWIVLFLCYSSVLSTFDPTNYNPATLTAYSGEISYVKPACNQGSSCTSVYTFTITPAPDGSSLSGIISDSTQLIDNQKKCSSIAFVFKEMQLRSAELRISDISPLKTFFTCASCHTSDRTTSTQNSYMPPLFNSSTGSVKVVVTGTTGSGTSTFSLQYACNVMYTTPSSVTSTTSTIEMSTGYGTVRPMLSIHHERVNAINKATPKLFPATTQVFVIRNPVRWTWDTSTTQTWQQISTQDPTNRIKLAVQLMNWRAEYCAVGSGISLRIYKSQSNQNDKIYDACSSTIKVNSDKLWIDSNNDGYARVELVNSNMSPNDGKEVYFEIEWLADSDLWECGEMAQPDRIAADSWMITDGSKGFISPKNNADQRMSISSPLKTCDWLLAPYTDRSVASTVTLIFRWVSLKPGSKVVVYDNSQASGSVLWDSGQIFFENNFEGFTFTTPPPIISSGSSLYIVYSTDPRTVTPKLYLGFAGEFVSNSAESIGFGDKKALLSMASAIDVTPPGNGSMYAKGMIYEWLIEPRAIINNATVVTGPITFAVGALSLPQGDSLTIYDGSSPNTASVLRVLTGDSIPSTWITSTGSVASMRFESASTSIRRGVVRVSFFTDGPNYHCGFTRNPALLTAISMTITDGSYSKEPLYRNQHCQWTIAPVNAVGIFLSFNRFKMFGGSVKIYSGPVSNGVLIATITETAAVPAPIYLPVAIMGIEYKSGPVVEGFGFSATYFGISRALPARPGDGIIKLFSSSMQNLQYLSYHDIIHENETVEYLIRPASVVSNSTSIFFSIAALNLSSNCKESRLEIYDGDYSIFNRTDRNASNAFVSPAERLLATLCGTHIPNRWIKTSGPVATLRIISQNISKASQSVNKTLGSFSLSYFADAPSSHCGFPANPGLLTAPSMVFSDGSASNERMYASQSCEFVIAPSVVQKKGLVVLEFLESDLRGGSVSVYDGTLTDSIPNPNRLLWQCAHCTVLPRLLISRTGGFFVRYFSEGMGYPGPMGSGFKAIYWTTNESIATDFTIISPASIADLFPSELTSSAQLVLELPLGYLMSSSIANKTAAWQLGVFDKLSLLKVTPGYASQAIANLTHAALDGRPGGDIFDSLVGSAAVCGLLTTSEASLATTQTAGRTMLRFLNESIMMGPTQRSSYLASTISSKFVHRIIGGQSDVQGPVHAARVCKYTVDSSTTQSVTINIVQFSPGDSGARLRVLAGVQGNDALLFDSGSGVGGVSLLAWCGVATIIVETTSFSPAPPTHSLELSYILNTKDAGTDCIAYKLSLLPKIVLPDPLIPLYIALGALGACCFSCVLFYHIRRYIRRNWPEGGFYALFCQKMRTYQVVTPRHLRYTPRFDAIRNRLLQPGKCCVCQEEKLPVFRLDCRHGICEEDIKGYLSSALGDISMFPVKCPLHYEGCTGSITAHISKRVLSAPMFDKFNEFSDRSTYGEGMRCIFCDNFVNFPIEGAISMVECPYCVQRFCMRCKKSWHFGSKCPLDKVDDSLDDWRQKSLAQRCPCCHKLIEKDDPNTCNHMVHKITDGIPCIRDRTDFCYLCGEEVTQDYPHDEVKNPGVNHFPDGVFQQCRKQAAREREADRERLKKLRRMRGKKPGDRGVQNFGFGVLGADENNPEYEDHNWDDEDGEKWEGLSGGRTGDSGDVFDAQWDRAIGPASRQTATRASTQGSPSAPSVPAMRQSPGPPRRNSNAPAQTPPHARPSSNQTRRNNGSRVSPIS